MEAVKKNIERKDKKDNPKKFTEDITISINDKEDFFPDNTKVTFRKSKEFIDCIPNLEKQMEEIDEQLVSYRKNFDFKEAIPNLEKDLEMFDHQLSGYAQKEINEK